MNAKSEFRNPKPERNPKTEGGKCCGTLLVAKRFSDRSSEVVFGFRISAFFRISGIRISDFGQKFSQFILFAACGWCVIGCQSARLSAVSTCKIAAKNLSAVADEVSSDAAQEQRSEAFARFASGISYELNNKSDLATDQFYRAVLADPSNEPLAIETAQRFSRAKQFDKATQILTSAARQRQASGDIFSALSHLYLVTGKTNLAIDAAESAIKKSPASIAGYQTLVELFLKKGETEPALRYLNDASRQTNSDSIFLISLGELFGRAMRAQPKEADDLKQKALEVLNRAAAWNPTNANVRLKLADNFARFDDRKKAAQLYLELLNEFGDMPLMRDSLREKLANLYLKSSDKSKAAEQLEAIVRESPTRYPEAWYYLGTLAHEKTNYTKAAEYFGRAILLDPDVERAYYDLAATQISMDQAGEALKNLDKAREKFPNSFTAEFFTGLAYARLKNYADALKHFTAAEIIAKTTDTPLNHLFFFQLGSIYERNHDYVQAEKYFEKCLQLAPDFPEALNYLGFMWADRGENLEKARALIEKAVKLEPKNAAYLDSLGWVLFKLKEHERALQYILQAVALSDVTDPSVYDHLGDVYSALKQNDKARDAWEKSIAIEPNETVEKKIQSPSL